MDALLDYVQQLISYIEANGANLNQETQQQLAVVLQEVMGLIAEQGANQPEPPEQPPQITPNEPPIGDSATLLWVLAGGQPNAFVSYLREFPDPALANLLANPDMLAHTIERLQRDNPIERIGQADGIPQAPLQSSNVYGFRFNPHTKKLQVRFQGGSLYEYEGVPDQIFNLFSNGNASAKTEGKNRYGEWWRGKNPSLGAALNQYIKAGNYPYRRIR